MPRQMLVCCVVSVLAAVLLRPEDLTATGTGPHDVSFIERAKN